MKSPQHLLLWLWDAEEGKGIFGSAINRRRLYLGDKKKIQPTSVVATTTACHLQHKLPTELVQLIFSHIHPSHAFKYRRLCRRIDACLSSTSFVALNLDRFVTLATPPPLSTPSSPPAAVAAAAKQMVFESCEYTAYFHRIWTDDRARRLFLFRSGGGRGGGLVDNHPQIQREIASTTRKGISMIPKSLGMITTLTYLKLNHLGLTGRFADAVTLHLISTLSALTDFGSRVQYACLARFLWSCIPRYGHLRTLKLNNNSFSGGLVPEIRCLRNLESNNHFSREIPCELGNLSDLRFLFLQNNQLTGTVPVELGRLRNIDMVSVKGNLVSLPKLRAVDGGRAVVWYILQRELNYKA
ncbi:hypothetical protein BDR26DRAFT_1002781 [Obelidium mucronatum]|nr:hypothetical protein BDR26DRAFT_1002781 [Obelidium mucronatum]